MNIKKVLFTALRILAILFISGVVISIIVIGGMNKYVSNNSFHPEYVRNALAVAYPGEDFVILKSYKTIPESFPKNGTMCSIIYSKRYSTIRFTAISNIGSEKVEIDRNYYIMQDKLREELQSLADKTFKEKFYCYVSMGTTEGISKVTYKNGSVENYLKYKNTLIDDVKIGLYTSEVTMNDRTIEELTNFISGIEKL